MGGHWSLLQLLGASAGIPSLHLASCWYYKQKHGAAAAVLPASWQHCRPCRPWPGARVKPSYFCSLRSHYPPLQPPVSCLGMLKHVSPQLLEHILQSLLLKPSWPLVPSVPGHCTRGSLGWTSISAKTAQRFWLLQPLFVFPCVGGPEPCSCFTCLDIRVLTASTWNRFGFEGECSMGANQEGRC